MQSNEIGKYMKKLIFQSLREIYHIRFYVYRFLNQSKLIASQHKRSDKSTSVFGNNPT